ncbi:hypothetical protein Bca52824_016882 [Brassica carinata]|uniref:Uncharacterized protein n=1 Tax=Brassica carinata TaxID=52824 RepID=A0A8X7W4E8_BRACI|nr:hypothetical protein Bca52824_016882 [Brassica carinata]
MGDLGQTSTQADINAQLVAGQAQLNATMAAITEQLTRLERRTQGQEQRPFGKNHPYLEDPRRAKHDPDSMGRFKTVCLVRTEQLSLSDLAGRIQTSQLDLSSELSWSMYGFIWRLLETVTEAVTEQFRDSYPGWLLGGYLTTRAVGTVGDLLENRKRRLRTEKETAGGSYGRLGCAGAVISDGFGAGNRPTAH